MRMSRGGKLYLPAYFEDSNNDPVTGQVANVLYHWRATDDGAGADNQAATSELGGGWYMWQYEDTYGWPLVYWATLSGYKNFPGGIVEISNIITSSGTFTHTSGTTESSAIFYYNTGSDSRFPYAVLRSAMLDMSAITKDTIVRIKQRIGGNVRTLDSIHWNTSMDNAILFSEVFFSDWVQITVQSVVAEGASRNIPYYIYYELLP